MLSLKNSVIGALTLLTIGLMIWVASVGGAYHGGEHSKFFGDTGNQATKDAVSPTLKEKTDREKENEKLKALRDKAGNVGKFKVSDEYKRKCASCHGANGSGFQNGKAMMGPKLIGQSAEKVYKDLVEFKSGRKENVVMKGLLLPLSDEDLKRFADEIGEFSARAEAVKK